MLSNDWTLQVAAGNPGKEKSSTHDACTAASLRMIGSPVEFVHSLGRLYLSAKTEAQRQKVIAVDPGRFQVMAAGAGEVWSAQDAGFLPPSAQAGCDAFSYDHDVFGRVSCHIGDDDGAAYVAGVYQGPNDILDYLKPADLSLILQAFDDHLAHESRESEMDFAAARRGALA